MAACRPWLEAELAVVKPRVLVLLGATAAQSLLGRQFRVTQHRGELLESRPGRSGHRDGASLVHPARRARRSGSRTSTAFVDDLKRRRRPALGPASSACLLGIPPARPRPPARAEQDRRLRSSGSLSVSSQDGCGCGAAKKSRNAYATPAARPNPNSKSLHPNLPVAREDLPYAHPAPKRPERSAGAAALRGGELMRGGDAKHRRARTAENCRSIQRSARAAPARVPREAAYLKLARKRSFRASDASRPSRSRGSCPRGCLRRPRATATTSSAVSSPGQASTVDSATAGSSPSIVSSRRACSSVLKSGWLSNGSAVL